MTTCGQGLDVEAARGDVRRDEDRDLVVLEVVERADALRLALVAVDRDGRDAVEVELLGEPVRAVLGAREDERLVDAAALDELAEQLALRLRSTGMTTWRDELRGRVPGAWPGRTPGRSGTRRRASRISAENVAEKSRFWRCLGSRARILRMSWMKPMSSMRSASSRTRISTRLRSIVRCVDVVEQAARRRDDDLRACAQPANLLLEADAAVDGGRADRALRAVGADALLDLERELAGRGQDEHA